MIHSDTRFVVTIRFAGSAAEANAVLRDHPDLEAAIAAAAVRHGQVAATRLVGDDEFMDIDEWRRESDRDAFVADAGARLQEWFELAGAKKLETRLWRPPADGERA